MNITLATNKPLSPNGRVIASAADTQPNGNGLKPKVERATYSLYPEQIAFVDAQAQALMISASQFMRELVTQEQRHGLVAGAKAQRALAARQQLRKTNHKK